MKHSSLFYTLFLGVIGSLLMIPALSFAAAKMNIRQEGNTTESWTLTDGGKILNIKSESSSERGDRSATLVYEKK